jgi:hypothetical protein
MDGNRVYQELRPIWGTLLPKVISKYWPTYGELANGWENCELEPSNFQRSPEAVLIDFQ